MFFLEVSLWPFRCSDHSLIKGLLKAGTERVLRYCSVPSSWYDAILKAPKPMDIQGWIREQPGVLRYDP